MGIRTLAMVSLMWCACTDASEPVVNTPRVHIIAEGGGGGGGGGGPTLLASMMASATKCGEINVTWWSYPAGFARLELITQVGTEPATTRNLQVSATSYDSTNLAQNTSITYTLRAYDAADTFLQQVSTAGKSAACTGTGGNQIGQYLPQNLDLRA